MAISMMQQYATHSARQERPQPARGDRKRAALGALLVAGVCTICCMGAPALAGDATSRGEPRVGTSAAVAVPNFLTYALQSRVAAGVGTTEGVRPAANARTIMGQAGGDGTDEEEDSEMAAEQDTRPPGQPQVRRGLIDDSGSMNWEVVLGLRTMPRQ